MTSKNDKNFFAQDIHIVLFSILIAVVLVKTGALSTILSGAASLKILGSFIAGIFFTSVFTTAPAIVALGEIATQHSLLWTAFFGALGAVIGDLVIFSFIRDRLSEHLMILMEHTGSWRRIKALFRLKYFRWGTFLLGGLLIASPFPDELAISLLGFTRMKTGVFIPISFVFNFVGIVVIGLVARGLTS